MIRASTQQCSVSQGARRQKSRHGDLIQSPVKPMETPNHFKKNPNPFYQLD